MNPLSQRALLCNLNIRCWKGEVTDENAVRIVASTTKADTSGDKYVKSLFIGNPLASVNRVANRARTNFYYYSLPWSDGGARILPSLRFREFSIAHKTIDADFENEVEAFCGRYPEHVERAREAKGDLFIEANYPTVDQVREKFKMRLSSLPFPDTSDFRVEAAEDVIQELKGGYEESLTHITTALDGELVQQFDDRLRKMLDTLSNDKIFKQPHFDELQHIVDFAISLDTATSDKTNKIVALVKTNLLTTNAEAVRTSESHKSDFIKRIKRIIAYV